MTQDAGKLKDAEDRIRQLEAEKAQLESQTATLQGQTKEIAARYDQKVLETKYFFPRRGSVSSWFSETQASYSE